MVAFPPVHVGRPYEKPTAPCVLRTAILTADGAALAVFVYAKVQLNCGVDGRDGMFLNGLEQDGRDKATSKQCVLFLHGNGEEHGIFGPTIDAVVEAGCIALALDVRAQGASTRGTLPLSYELFADDACLVLDELGVAHPVHVVGFSDGAITGLLLALRDAASASNTAGKQRVASLLAVGANLEPEWLPAEDLAYFKETAKALRLWSREGYEGAVNEEGLEVYAPARAAEIAELLELMLKEPHIDLADLTALNLPCIIASGVDDEIDWKLQRSIAAAIPGALFELVDNCDHNVPKMQPQTLSALVFWLINAAQGPS